MERKQQVKKAVISYRQRMKLRLIEYKGGQCKECGYNKSVPGAYVFHHRNPEEKDFAVSGKSLKWETLKKEADKCDLLCCNCHAEKHDEKWQKKRDKNIIDYKNHQKSFLKELFCKYCNVEFRPKNRRQKYCSVKCAKLSSRKCNRPTKKELEKLLKIKSWSAIGRQYGVTDNAIRKWAKYHNIPTSIKHNLEARKC